MKEKFSDKFLQQFLHDPEFYELLMYTEKNYLTEYEVIEHLVKSKKELSDKLVEVCLGR